VVTESGFIEKWRMPASPPRLILNVDQLIRERQVVCRYGHTWEEKVV
jgi:hypothetical protein